MFNWFKKKDKMIPLEPADSGQDQGKSSPNAHSKPEHKPSGRPAMAGAKKTAPPDKDASKINTSESSVIRIGKLGEVLLQYDMISRENLEKALVIQQKSFVASGPQDKAVQKRKLLGEILVENNFVTEEQLLSAFARHCRIPYIKLNKYGLPKEAIKSVPEDLIIKHKVMPVDKIGSMLMLAVTDPYDTNAVEEVKTRTGLRVKTILCKQSEFAEMVKFYYPHINEKPLETPAAGVAESAPKSVEPEIDAKPTPVQEARLGEETAVFNIEELPFPEPPPPIQKLQENIQETPTQQAVPTAAFTEKPPEALPKDISVGQTTPATESTPETLPEETSRIQTDKIDSLTKDKKEYFLGESIEETYPGTQPQPLKAPDAAQGESKISDQGIPSTPPEISAVNSYDTSIIDIQDLVAAQKITSNEDIEILPEEPEPIDVTPYIYPEAKEPKTIFAPQPKTPAENIPEIKKKTEIPSPKISPAAYSAPKETSPVKDKDSIRSAEEKKQSPPISVQLPEPEKTEKKLFKNNPVLINDDEFLVARQLFTTQLAYSWEKLYHRSKPSHAEKVDENEFVFYTESAIH